MVIFLFFLPEIWNIKFHLHVDRICPEKCWAVFILLSFVNEYIRMYIHKNHIYLATPIGYHLCLDEFQCDQSDTRYTYHYVYE